MKFAILFLSFLAALCCGQNVTCFSGDSRQILNTIQCEKGCVLTRKREFWLFGSDYWISGCEDPLYPCWLLEHSCCKDSLCNKPPNGLLPELSKKE